MIRRQLSLIQRGLRLVRTPGVGIRRALLSASAVPRQFRMFSTEATAATSESPSIGQAEKMGFQTETRQILDIVTNSLYTDKEVFLREIISNASDASEKARYFQTSNKELRDSDKGFEVRITADEAANTLTIQDFGIGMTRQELIDNLGTIARSGSKAFVKELASQGATAAANIIGQFGVGFYATFMVADKVEVYTKSGPVERDGTGHYWVSDGTGTFSIAPAENVTRGTKIILHLKKDQKQFSLPHVIEGIVKKYSNFVGFPIFLNEKKVNTVDAIWTMNKDAVTEEQHLEFYRYIANAYDSPMYRLQFRTDAPLDIKALFYLPERHMEKYGMGRMEVGVSLYSRKVLIQPKCKALLPEWARFVKGVVDSEDIPLNISRENMQDSALLNKISSVLTRKLIKFLEEESRTNESKYNQFYEEFGTFIKEGICTDFLNKSELARLVRYETSLGEPGKTISLDDYIGNMPPSQKGIYYLLAPNRSFALSSPYMEAFTQKKINVLLLYANIDEFVMQNLGEYNKRKFISVESAEAGEELAEKKASEPAQEESKTESKINEDALCKWFQESLSDRLSSVKTTTRLSSSPAIVVDHESAALRKLMRMVNQNLPPEPLPKQKLELNCQHPIIVKLDSIKDSNPEVAKLVAEQVFDNALIAADILDNPRTMLTRLNSILDHALKQ